MNTLNKLSQHQHALWEQTKKVYKRNLSANILINLNNNCLASARSLRLCNLKSAIFAHCSSLRSGASLFQPFSNSPKLWQRKGKGWFQKVHPGVPMLTLVICLCQFFCFFSCTGTGILPLSLLVKHDNECVSLFDFNSWHQNTTQCL